MGRCKNSERTVTLKCIRIEPEDIYEQFKEHTIIPKKRFLENIRYALWLEQQVEFPKGGVVECGVWRGGMTAGFLKVFGESRSYLLFDSFEGLPPPNENDGEDALWWASHPNHPRYFDNCKAPSFHVRELLSKEASSGFNVSIVEGWFSDTLPRTSIRPIAFLHLDSDWYDSTYQCLCRLWKHVLPGGAIIIDDYFDWEGCRRAVHDFLSQIKAREAIERVGTSGGACIRRLGAWDISESPHLECHQ